MWFDIERRGRVWFDQVRRRRGLTHAPPSDCVSGYVVKSTRVVKKAWLDLERRGRGLTLNEIFSSSIFIILTLDR